MNDQNIRFEIGNHILSILYANDESNTNTRDKIIFCEYFPACIPAPLETIFCHFIYLSRYTCTQDNF